MDRAGKEGIEKGGNREGIIQRRRAKTKEYWKEMCLQEKSKGKEEGKKILKKRTRQKFK